jgi:predicted amidohydrolase YtcJ
VLSRNPLSTPPADLAQIQVLRTIVDGRAVHLDDA